MIPRKRVPYLQSRGDLRDFARSASFWSAQSMSAEKMPEIKNESKYSCIMLNQNGRDASIHGVK